MYVKIRRHPLTPLARELQRFQLRSKFYRYAGLDLDRLREWLCIQAVGHLDEVFPGRQIEFCLWFFCIEVMSLRGALCTIKSIVSEYPSVKWSKESPLQIGQGHASRDRAIRRVNNLQHKR